MSDPDQMYVNEAGEIVLSPELAEEFSSLSLETAEPDETEPEAAEPVPAQQIHALAEPYLFPTSDPFL